MGERLGNRAISTSGCRIQGVSKVVRPCERRRNSRVWWSSNGEWQTNTCEFCSGIFQGYRNEAFQWVNGRRSHRTSHVSNWNVSQWPAFPWNVTKGMQIMENPVSRRRPCQKRQLVDVIGDQGEGCPKQHTKEGIWAVLKKKFHLVRSWGIAYATTYASLMRPQCQLTHGDSSILLTGQLTLTYTSQGFAYMHILMTTSLLTTFFRGAPQRLGGNHRHPSLCQQNRHHSMSSLTKFVLPALEDLVSISILNVWQHFTCDDLVFNHCMATFHEDLSRFWSPPKSFDLMLHTSNTTVHLTQWCQGHLNGGETGQQGDFDFRL